MTPTHHAPSTGEFQRLPVRPGRQVGRHLGEPTSSSGMASIEQIDTWAERMLSAATLTELRAD